MTVAARVRSYLSDRGVEFSLMTHPRTGSTRESALQAHVAEDHIAKAVVTRDAVGYCMAVIPGASWLRLEALRSELNRDLTLAEESEIAPLFPDCEPGALPPFGWLYGMETCVDLALTSLANLYFESGDHEHLVHVSGEDFRALLQGARQGHYSRDD